ncbi:hypothetical protein ACIBEK_24150 [Nocardia fusca]|uniref:hypothetical protein n=1 Tax=Nocardia fusca TaxID=941183 RepID=UPI0037B4D9C0
MAHSRLLPDPDLLLGMSTVADGGRVSDKPLLDALGWDSSARLGIESLDTGVLRARAAADGTVPVSPKGFFRVPFRVRRRALLFLGDRVLLLAHRKRSALLIYPPAVIGEMFSDGLRHLEG